MKLREQLVYFARKTARIGLVSGLDGNLSVRKKNGTILITGSGLNKGALTENDICVIDSAGNKLKGKRKVSTEAKLHLAFYNNRKDVKAVVHCHPVFATALATAGVELNVPIFPEVVLGLGRIGIAGYATPSTDEVPNSLMPFIKTAVCVVLKNHGAVTVGSSPEEAYYRMETLEHAMKMYFTALLSGSPEVLNGKQLSRLYEIAPAAYGINLPAALKYPIE